ncbi:hypothetical protein LTR62_004016 [Meristemomyces frigidus]|uniref:RBR-type E3 ubiquitin transferase n=1 Tax=Meristemomyces frigidus TaxID=1508187 RepID=A0AAN7TPI4_9PEZI|nr:hypothetical protein LTR62_004016 [Meristemomyces frigidus]
MSVLKRMLSWTKRRDVSDENLVAPDELPVKVPARSNAKLKKRGVMGESQRETASIVDKESAKLINANSSGPLPPSRVNSFGPEQELLGFEIESQKMEALRRRIRSDHDLPGRYVGHSALSSALHMEDLTLDTTAVSSSSTTSTSNISWVSAVPAIPDLDWSKISDGELERIKSAYDKSSRSRMVPRDKTTTGDSRQSSKSSPVNSAISAFEDVSQPYAGKGKARALRDLVARPSSERASSIMDSWIEESRQTALGQGPYSINLNRQAAERLQAHLEAEGAEIEAEQHAQMIALSNRECNVCSDTKPSFNFPIKPPTANCDHPITTCTLCLETWLATEITTKGTTPIKCPSCPFILTYTDILRSASPAAFTAYDALTTRAALTCLEEFAWCLNPLCSNGQLNPAENKNYMSCAACGYQQCLLHRIPWHSGESCAAYSYRTSAEGRAAAEAEKKSEVLMEKLSKRCPGQGCGWRIEKVGGCEHMSCARCGAQFCWL